MPKLPGIGITLDNTRTSVIGCWDCNSCVDGGGLVIYGGIGTVIGLVALLYIHPFILHFIPGFELPQQFDRID